MRMTEELEFSTTTCSRCADKERLIVKTRDGVVSRCYVCGDEASWLKGARANATSAAVSARDVSRWSFSEGGAPSRFRSLDSGTPPNDAIEKP
jgi:hypothetical protein